MKTHIHLYFAAWRGESRAWRAGTVAIEAGHADEVLYVGHKAVGCPDREDIAPNQTILRIGTEPPRPGSPRLLRALALPRWWWACGRDLASKNVSLVVAHSLASLPIAVFLSRCWRTPLLYDAHELETQREGWSRPIRALAQLVEWLFIRFSDHTIVVNDSIKDWYQRRYPSVSVTTLRNTPSIDRMLVPPGQLRRDLGVGEEDLLFLYLGRFGPGRGIDLMIEAFKKLPSDKHAVFLGDGPWEEWMKGEAGKHSNIHLLKPVSPETVASYASSADVGVSIANGKSLSYQYGLGNKIFEYSLAGLALIVSDIPEQRKYVENHARGWIIPACALELEMLVRGLTRESIKARPEGKTLPPSWETERQVLLSIFLELANKCPSRADQAL